MVVYLLICYCQWVVEQDKISLQLQELVVTDPVLTNRGILGWLMGRSYYTPISHHAQLSCNEQIYMQANHSINSIVGYTFPQRMFLVIKHTVGGSVVLASASDGCVGRSVPVEDESCCSTLRWLLGTKPA